MNLRVLLQKKNKFWRPALLAMAAGVLCGLVYSISIPKQYDSAAVLLPEASNTSVSVSKLKSISALVGASLDFSSDALKPLFYGDIIMSEPFLEEILDIEVSTLDGGLTTTLRDYLLNHQKQPWWGLVTGLPGRLSKSLKGAVGQSGAEAAAAGVLTEDEMELIHGFAGNVVADVSHITRRTVVRVRMQDPLVACQTASAIVDNLHRHIQAYRSEKNTENYLFIKEACEQEKERILKDRMEYAYAYDSNMDMSTALGKTEMEQKLAQIQMDMEIYTQMYLQSKLSQLNADSMVPAFRVLQPPMVVLKAAEPRTLLCMLRFSLVFLFVCILYFIVRRLWE